MSESEANKMQVGGNRYASEGMQHWDFAASVFGPAFFYGTITKYVVRARKKNGIQDLRKARHYLQKLAEVYWEELGWNLGEAQLSAKDETLLNQYLTDAKLTPREEAFVRTLLKGPAMSLNIPLAMTLINELIHDAQDAKTQEDVEHVSGYLAQ